MGCGSSLNQIHDVEVPKQNNPIQEVPIQPLTSEALMIGKEEMIIP